MQHLLTSTSHLLKKLWLLPAVLGLGGCTWPGSAPWMSAHYTSGGTQLEILIFPPDETPPAEGWPTLLLFHGGAWQRGDPEAWRAHCEVFQLLGYQCISAAYRVAERDGTGVREAITDARAALDKLRQETTRWHINPQRLVLGGGSAGGHLAALLATGQQGLQPPEAVAGLLLFNPMLDLSPGQADHQYVADYWQQVSPYHQLQHHLPPTLILLGDQDTELPLPIAQRFCKKAQAIGSRCELDIAEGHGHGFFNRHYSRWQYLRTLWRSYEFLETLAD